MLDQYRNEHLDLRHIKLIMGLMFARIGVSSAGRELRLMINYAGRGRRNLDQYTAGFVRVRSSGRGAAQRPTTLAGRQP